MLLFFVILHMTFALAFFTCRGELESLINEIGTGPSLINEDASQI